MLAERRVGKYGGFTARSGQSVWGGKRDGVDERRKGDRHGKVVNGDVGDGRLVMYGMGNDAGGVGEEKAVDEAGGAGGARPCV